MDKQNLRKPRQSRYVPIERVRPLVAFLEDRYGGLPKVAEASGIPYRTLQGIMQAGKTEYVLRRTAKSIVKFVLTHKRPEWTAIEGGYENETPPRLATQEERDLNKRLQARMPIGKSLKWEKTG